MLFLLFAVLFTVECGFTINVGDINIDLFDDDELNCDLYESIHVLDDMILAFRCGKDIAPIDVDDEVKKVLELVDDPLIDDPFYSETIAYYTGLVEGEQGCNGFKLDKFFKEIDKFIKCYPDLTDEEDAEILAEVKAMFPPPPAPEKKRIRRRRKRV